jgi:hypothetical protein
VECAIEEFAGNARLGEVYNIADGHENSVPMLESMDRIEQMTAQSSICFTSMRCKGDHICYNSDLREFKNQYTSWRTTRSLDSNLEVMIASERLLPTAISA